MTWELKVYCIPETRSWNGGESRVLSEGLLHTRVSIGVFIETIPQSRANPVKKDPLRPTIFS